MQPPENFTATEGVIDKLNSFVEDFMKIGLYNLLYEVISICF
jgi:hypothetical protein